MQTQTEAAPAKKNGAKKKTAEPAIRQLCLPNDFVCHVDGIGQLSGTLDARRFVFEPHEGGVTIQLQESQRRGDRAPVVALLPFTSIGAIVVE